MRKTFRLTHPKMKVARIVESIKHDVKKYLKRERKKELPEGADFWDFNCKFGVNAEESETIHLSEINKLIDEAQKNGLESFYLEILAKAGYRQKKPNPTSQSEDLNEAHTEGTIDRIQNPGERISTEDAKRILDVED